MDRLSINCFAALIFLQCALLVNGECDQVASTTRRSGNSAQFKVRVPKNVIRWEMDVAFSSPVTSLKTGDATFSTHDNILFHLTSHSHRLGKDVAELEVSYTPTGPSPKITSIVINGRNECKVSSVPHLKSSKPKMLPSKTSSNCKNRTTSSTSRTLKPSTTMPAVATKISSTAVVTKATSPPTTVTKTITTTRTITKALKPRTSTVTRTITTTIQPTATLTTTLTTTKTIQVTTTMTTSPPTPIVCASPHIFHFESSTPETVALMNAAAEVSSDNGVLLQPSIVPEELQPFAELVTTWNGGYALNLHIHFPYQAAEWIVDVDFSQPYQCIAIEGADILDMSGDGFSVFGSSPQPAHSTYDAIRVNVAYDPAHPTPILRQILLNYVPITYYTSKLNLKRSEWNTTQTESVRQLPNAQTQINCTGCCKCSYDVQCACQDATIDSSRSCRSIISSSQSSSVPGTFDDHVTIDLNIPFTADQIWEIVVIFSAPVDNLEATDFTVYKITDTQFGLLSSNVADHPCPNSVHSLRLIAQYSQTKPQIIAVGMNNQTLCSAA